MITKQTVLRFIFYAEVMVVAILYIASPHGLRAIAQLHRECTEADIQLMHVKESVALLEREITLWESDPFYKEKIAREQLQMVRKGDEVYYV